MEQSNTSPKVATSRNIIEDWCAKKEIKEANLTKDEWRQIVAYAVNVGQSIGIMRAKGIYEREMAQSVKVDVEGNPLEGNLSEKTEQENLD